MKLAAEFYATLMGGTVSYDPPPPDSMLAWLLAQPRPLAPGAISAEWARRGIVVDDAGVSDPPRSVVREDEEGTQR
jgi:hypothetical protein